MVTVLVNIDSEGNTTIEATEKVKVVVINWHDLIEGGQTEKIKPSKVKIITENEARNQLAYAENLIKDNIALREEDEDDE